MIREVEAKHTIKYEEYWVLRGIHEEYDKKTVVAEEKYMTFPTEQYIVDFLLRGKGTFEFVSVEHNYRLV